MSSEFDLQAELGNIMEHDIVRRPSYFQLKYFVLGKEPTIQAKLWCCIRELRNRRDSMVAMRAEIEETKDNRELLQIKIERLLSYTPAAESCFDKMEKEVNVRKHRRQMESLVRSLENLRRTLKETEEEAEFLVKAFRSLERLEELKPLDDVQAQNEYWNEKFSQKLDLLTLLHKPLDAELVHSILLLDDRTPVKKKVVSIMEMLRRQAIGQAVARPTISLEPQEPKECPPESQA